MFGGRLIQLDAETANQYGVWLHGSSQHNPSVLVAHETRCFALSVLGPATIEGIRARILGIFGRSREANREKQFYLARDDWQSNLYKY